MAMLNAGDAGRFRIGGEVDVVRLGFGSMRLTAEGIWGEPKDVPEARRVLARASELGIDFIDTADSYGPFVAEDLIAQVLHPYKNLFVATKGGLVRPGPVDGKPWPIVGDPDYLRQCVKMSLRRLRRDRLDLWQLHRIDSKVPRDEQFGVIREFLDTGLIRFAGLSQVSIEEIEAARKVFPVATVQNRFNLADQADVEVLDYCEREGIGFIPWAPLAAGALAKPGGAVAELARRKNVTAGQIALAWMLRRSPVMLPIPGTSTVAHLEDNVAAAAIKLSDEEFAQLDQAAGAN